MSINTFRFCPFIVTWLHVWGRPVGSMMQMTYYVRVVPSSVRVRCPHPPSAADRDVIYCTRVSIKHELQPRKRMRNCPLPRPAVEFNLTLVLVVPYCCVLFLYNSQCTTSWNNELENVKISNCHLSTESDNMNLYNLFNYSIDLWSLRGLNPGRTGLSC